MSTRTFALLALVLISVLAALSLIFVRRSLQREQELGAGGLFPAVELQMLDDRSEVAHLPSGRKSLIVFFSPECPHCASELARLDRACRQAPEGRIECLAVSFSPEPATRAWLLTSGLALKTAVVRDPDFTRRYVDWLTAVPLVFLVDEHGVIEYKRAGERSDEYNRALVQDFARP